MREAWIPAARGPTQWWSSTPTENTSSASPTTAGSPATGTPSPASSRGHSTPAWSPDGTKILFAHDALTPTGEFTTGLQTINPDGTGQQYIADTRGIEHTADWGTAPLAP